MILSGRRPNTFPRRSETRQECLLSPFLVSILLKVLVGAGEKKFLKRRTYRDLKGKNKTVFVVGVTVYIENSKNWGTWVA